MNIQWQKHKLDDVMDYFVHGFAPKKDGTKVLRAEWFVDPVKNTVVFMLYVDEPPDNRPE